MRGTARSPGQRAEPTMEQRRKALGGGDVMTKVFGIAAKHLITAITGKRDLDMLPGQSGQRECWNERRVAERFVEAPEQFDERLRTDVPARKTVCSVPNSRATVCAIGDSSFCVPRRPTEKVRTGREL